MIHLTERCVTGMSSIASKPTNPCPSLTSPPHLPLHTDFYSKYMTGIRIEQKLFEDVFRATLPKLAAHLDSCGLPLSIVTTNWFMCLYTNTLPAETLLRVWDLLFEDFPC